MTDWRYFEFCRGSAFRFFGRRRIGAMADHRHHGEGEHHQGNVAMPPMPGSALVVIEPELVFRGLKTVLDRPPISFDGPQRFKGCARSPLAPGVKHMCAACPEYIAFARPTQLLLDIANTVDGVTSNPLEWHSP